MNTACLLLGSNMGKRENYLSQAIELLNEIGKGDKGQWARAKIRNTKYEIRSTRVITASSIYNTKAWGNKNQNDFLNQAVCIETSLSAEKLLKEILSIEKSLGRTRGQKPEARSQKWQPREIDIDILFFNQQIINSINLQVPHPHLHERKFALVPLAEIAGEFIHPVLKKSVKELLKECKDKLTVEKKVLPNGEDLGGAPFFISIEGNIGAGKTTLAKILAKELNASLLLEKFDENPHLAKFYENPKEHALKTELWFLTERCEQMERKLPIYQSANPPILISDYHISKCLIFAKANLEKKQFMIYEKFFKDIAPLLPKPDLIIYLHQDIGQLKKNITKRGRTYEKKISTDYLNKIQKGYQSYLKNKGDKNVPVIYFQKHDFSLKKNIQSLISDIKSTTGY